MAGGHSGALRVRFWGVRGSVPSPGPATARYGGNTTCVSVDAGDEQTLVLDAGTGIRLLGHELMRSTPPSHDVLVLVTHMHFDHIQGFPFFAPLYQPSRRVMAFPEPGGRKMLCSLIEQMDGAHFPLTPDALPSDWSCVGNDTSALLREHGYEVSRCRANHPGNAVGFRVERGGRSIVFMPDNELDPPKNYNMGVEAFAQFAAGADVLIHDAQYLDAELPSRRGWGHSSVEQACDLAIEAGVKRLVCTHHDPDRDDDALDAIGEVVRERLRPHGIEGLVAREGMEVSI